MIVFILFLLLIMAFLNILSLEQENNQLRNKLAIKEAREKYEENLQ